MQLRVAPQYLVPGPHGVGLGAGWKGVTSQRAPSGRHACAAGQKYVFSVGHVGLVTEWGMGGQYTPFGTALPADGQKNMPRGASNGDDM